MRVLCSPSWIRKKHSFLFNSKAISWTLYNLARFPEHQQKCWQEIEEVFGEKEEFEWLVLMWSFQLSYCTYWVTCPVLRRQCSARSVPFRSRGPSEFVRASPRRSISTKKAWEGASWPGICTWLNGFRDEVAKGQRSSPLVWNVGFKISEKSICFPGPSFKDPIAHRVL